MRFRFIYRWRDLPAALVYEALYLLKLAERPRWAMTREERRKC